MCIGKNICCVINELSLETLIFCDVQWNSKFSVFCACAKKSSMDWEICFILQCNAECWIFFSLLFLFLQSLSLQGNRSTFFYITASRKKPSHWRIIEWNHTHIKIYIKRKNKSNKNVILAACGFGILNNWNEI